MTLSSEESSAAAQVEKEQKRQEAAVSILDSKKIFLCTFTPTPHVYSICPFAIKLESFLRINKIPYEPNYVKVPGPKGMVPWIILGGDDDDDDDDDKEKDNKDNSTSIPDSNVILSKIQEEFENRQDKEKVSYYSESSLTSFQKSTTHMLIRMLEEHLAQIGFYYRYGLHMEEFLSVLDIAERWPKGTAERWGPVQPEITKTKTKYRGLTRHNDEELWGFANDDIKVISEMLGTTNDYIFGGDKPTLADCAVFGHLTQFLWIPLDFPQKKFIHDECPNLVKFMNRFRDEYWPDWKELCDTLVDWN